MNKKNLNYEKPKVTEHGKIKHITMGSGEVSGESNRFDF